MNWIKTQDGSLVNLNTGCVISVWWNDSRTDISFPNDTDSICLCKGNVMETLYKIIPIDYDFSKEANTDV